MLDIAKAQSPGKIKMASSSSSSFPPSLQSVTEPNYADLMWWWDAWPEARPALLDFWARGNYSRRILYRTRTGRSSLLVRVAYLDEIEHALKRLTLLGTDVDFVWCGAVSGQQLVIVPQDIDYEDAGGWGYDTCAGDKIKDHRGNKEWCPAVGWASLLPDAVTDWLHINARAYTERGRIMVCPASHIGLTSYPGGIGEENLQRLSNAASLLRERAKIQALFQLELPYLEGMSVEEAHVFAEDNADSLVLFQSALSKLLSSSLETAGYESLSQDLVSAIQQGVAELRLSDRTVSARKTLAAIGAGIGTFLVTLGIHLGIPLGSAAIGSTGAAVASINMFAQAVENQGALRKNPFYAIWELQKGKKRRYSFGKQTNFLPGQPQALKRRDIPPFHWLSPPSGGWNIPTVIASSARE
jgi:hypothetical protein